MTHPPTQRGRRFRFAEYELREQTAELVKEGEASSLPEQAFLVLLTLLRASGELVSREELQQILWPGRTYGDFDGGINAAVRKLRRALQDDGAEPRLIGTLPRHGYRILVPVEAVGEEPAPADVAVAGAALGMPIRTRLTSWRGWMIGVLVAAAGIGAWNAWGLGRRHQGAERIRAVALLPLTNPDGDASQEFLAVSLTEQLIQELALRRDIQVAPFAAVSHLRQEGALPGDICHRLGVEAFVEGSVRHQEDRLILHLRLVQGRSGLAVWARTMDMPWKNLAELPSAGASQVAEALGLSSAPRVAVKRSRDAEATAACWEARYQLSLLNTGGIEQAAALYERATLKDPQFAAAYGGLATAELWRGLLNRGIAPSALRAAKENALRALDLDPSCGEANLVMAFIRWLYEWDFPAAERCFQKALEADPGAPQTHAAYASYLFFRGRPSEAEPHLNRAESNAKGDPIVAMDVLRCYTLSRRHAEALAFGRSIIASRPQWTWAHGHIFEACLAMGKEREAMDANMAAVADFPELARLLEQGRRQGTLQAMLRQEAHWNEAQHARNRSYEGPGVVAYLWAALGEKESALRWLEKAVEAQDYDSIYVLRFPYWDCFRGDPRYERLLQRMGIQGDPRSGS